MWMAYMAQGLACKRETASSKRVHVCLACLFHLDLTAHSSTLLGRQTHKTSPQKRAPRVLQKMCPLLLRGHRKKGTEKRPASLAHEGFPRASPLCPPTPFSKLLIQYTIAKTSLRDPLTLSVTGILTSVVRRGRLSLWSFLWPSWGCVSWHPLQRKIFLAFTPPMCSILWHEITTKNNSLRMIFS